MLTSNELEPLSMHPTIFEQVINRTRLSKDNRAIVRRILVDNEDQTKVLKEVSMARQSWYRILNTVKREHDLLLAEHKLAVVEIVVDQTNVSNVEAEQEELLISKFGKK